MLGFILLRIGQFILLGGGLGSKSLCSGEGGLHGRDSSLLKSSEASSFMPVEFPPKEIEDLCMLEEVLVEQRFATESLIVSAAEPLCILTPS